MPVHPAPHTCAVRLIVRARKGRRTAPALLPSFVLAGADGAQSPEARAVLRAAAALPFPENRSRLEPVKVCS